MIVYMYSKEELPIEVRTTFDLQAWPYSPKHEHLFIAYMKSLKVFRYEDDQIDQGSGYPINIETPTNTEQFVAYFSSCAVSNKDLSIINWPADDPAGYDLLKKIDEHPILKDRKAWFHWNIPVLVKNWDHLSILREEDFNKIDTCSVSRGCKENEVGKIVRES